MNLKVTDEFINICQEIISMNLAIEKWRSIESSDMFQSPNFCGGFDAVEEAFCFSYYDKEMREFWFQIDLQEIEEIVAGTKGSLSVRPAGLPLTGE